MKFERIAIAGASRKGDTAGNIIYRKLRDLSYDIYAVHPKAEVIEEDPAWPDLASLPEKVEGLIIATPPSAALDLVRQCHDQGIQHVWMHRSIGHGSVDDEAVEFCRANGINVIPGGCPLMFTEPVDFGHKCMRWLANVSGNLREPISAAS